MKANKKERSEEEKEEEELPGEGGGVELIHRGLCRDDARLPSQPSVRKAIYIYITFANIRSQKKGKRRGKEGKKRRW